MDLKIFGIENESIVDGRGFRFVLFVQGCPHNCAGCHNPKSHSFDSGKTYTTEQILEKVSKNPLLDGITFSGGEPFCQAKALVELGEKIKQKGLNIWTYTGYTFEELLKMSEKNTDIKELLALTDVLVDGKFIVEEKSLLLLFRGSKNQRLIDVVKSLKNDKALEIEYQDKTV